jgi:hypothetical protein
MKRIENIKNNRTNRSRKLTGDELRKVSGGVLGWGSNDSLEIINGGGVGNDGVL